MIQKYLDFLFEKGFVLKGYTKEGFTVIISTKGSRVRALLADMGMI